MAEAATLKLHQKKKRQPLSRHLFILALIVWPLAQFLVFWLYVNIDTVVMSFQQLDFNTGKQAFVGFDNFRWVWRQLVSNTDPTLRNSILNSIYLFLSNNFIILPVAIFVAYVLQKKLPGASIFRVIFFLPNIISVVVLTMAFCFMFNPSWGPFTGLLKWLHIGGRALENGLFGDKSTAMPMVLIYCLWAGIGYDVVLLSGAMNRIPADIYEAGKIDGIGIFRELVQVVVPMISGTITTLFISGVSVIFTLFLQPMLLTGGGPYGGLSGTIALFIVTNVNAGATQRYYAAATGLIFSLVGIPLIQTIKWGMEKVFPTVEY